MQGISNHPGSGSGRRLSRRSLLSRVSLTVALVTLMLCWFGASAALAQPSPMYLPYAAGAAYTVSTGANSGHHANSPYQRYDWDFAMPHGTPVLAAAAGVVQSAGWAEYGWGIAVSIRHSDGTVTVYTHLSAIPSGIRPGVAVGQAAHIGNVGSTGNSTGSHLHFGVHQNGLYGYSVPSRFTEAGVPGTGSRPVSANRPGGQDTRPTFEGLGVFSGPEVAVAAGDQVRFVVRARYLGPGERPCGHVRLGRRDDAPIPFADYAAGYFPKSWWVSPNRVVISNCPNSTLKPGEWAEFIVAVRPPKTHPGGTVSLGRMSIVHEGVSWSSIDPFELRLRITPAYRVAHVSQSSPPMLESGTGQTGWVSLRLRNSGTVGWDDQVRLAADGDRSIRFAVDGVIGTDRNRVAFERTGDGADGSIAPGEIATFRYKLQAPNGQAAAFRQRFHLVRESSGPHFGQALGIYVPTVMSSPELFPPELTVADCERVVYVSQTGTPLEDGRVVVTDSQPGQYTIRLANRNELCPLWRAGSRSFRLATRQPTDRGSGFASIGPGGWLSPSRVSLDDRLVAPGATTAVTFDLKAAAWVTPGTYDERFAGVFEGWDHLSDAGWFAPVRRR